MKGIFNIRKYTFQEQLISALIGIALGLAASLWMTVEVYAAEPQMIEVDVTAYHEGTHGSHGDRMRSGYVAYRPCDYGKAMLVYENINGSPGDLLYTLEVKDTGYGRDLGFGKSKVCAGENCGSIEAGRQIDIYRPTYSECVEVMKLTGGKALIQIIDAEG